MNGVQKSFTPPRVLAFIIGGLVFLIYWFGWRERLAALSTWGDPVAFPMVVICALIIGYGLAMVGWLIWKTKGQIVETFRPTRGRILGAIAMMLVLPTVVMGWMPWIIGGLIPFIIGEWPIYGIGVLLGITLACYPLSAMIVRHTYHRRLLRFGLFCLYFWTGYAFLLLLHGEMVFRM